MAEYSLYYFAIKGIVEPARYIFAYAEVPFRDIRRTQEEWPKFKNETPMGQMPVLEYKGQKLAQSKAIFRFLGNQFGLIGADNWENAQLDMLVERGEELTDALYGELYEQDRSKKLEKIAKVVEEKLIPGLKFFEDWLAKSTTGYFGSKITWSDFYFQHMFDWLLAMSEGKLEAKNFPKFSEFNEKIKSLPAVKKFRDSHPDVKFSYRGI